MIAMDRKTRNTSKQAPPIVSRAFLFWLAAGVLAYSLIVPLLALESMALAESILRFGILHQTAMLFLLALSTLSIFAEMITRGWQSRYLPSLIAVVLLLASVQPATECCTSLVAAISGMLPWSEVNPLDAIIHMMPIVGCTLIMVAPFLVGENGTGLRSTSRSLN
jgi:hypothetical protein